MTKLSSVCHLQVPPLKSHRTWCPFSLNQSERAHVPRRPCWQDWWLCHQWQISALANKCHKQRFGLKVCLMIFRVTKFHLHDAVNASAPILFKWMHFCNYFDPRSNCKKIIHFGTRTFRFLAGVKFQHEAAVWSRHHVLFQRAPPATTAFTAWRNCCIYLVWFAFCFGFIEWQHLTDHYCFNKT